MNLRGHSALFVAVAVLSFAPAIATNAAEGSDLPATTCTLESARQCAGNGPCEEVSLEDIALPGTVRLDPSQNLLVSGEGDRTTPIGGVERMAGTVVLHGSQNERTWSVVIEESEGRLFAVLSDPEGRLLVYGTCHAD